MDIVYSFLNDSRYTIQGKEMYPLKFRSLAIISKENEALAMESFENVWGAWNISSRVRT